MAVVSIAVEGNVDEAVARVLVAKAGHQAGPVYGRSGKSAIDKAIRGYNEASKFSPWFVLRDLDEDRCLVQLRDQLLPRPNPRMAFRIAVREVESWLIADRSALARHLGISEVRLPAKPDDEPDPKRAIMIASRDSRSRSVREGMNPGDDSSRAVGPGYDDILIEFVHNSWNPTRACRNSRSLAKCVRALEHLR